MRKLMTLLAVLATAFAFSAPASAQFFGKKDFIYEKGGYAIEGHDTVAYFDLDATDLDENGLPNAEAVQLNIKAQHGFLPHKPIWTGLTPSLPSMHLNIMAIALMQPPRAALPRQTRTPGALWTVSSI